MRKIAKWFTHYSRGFIILIVVLGASAQASGNPATMPSRSVAILGGPYCGVYSLCAAAAAAGRDLDVSQFMTRQYIGCYRGSSIAELLSAAHKAGLHAAAYGNLSFHYLTRAAHPVVLYVRSRASSPDYDHYVVALGPATDSSGHEGIRIVDPSAPSHVWGQKEIAERWNGTGIVISATSLNPLLVTGRQWLWLIPYIPLALILVFAARRAERSSWFRDVWFARLNSPLQAVCVVTVTALLAFAYQAAAHDGLLDGNGPAQYLDKIYREKNLPVISSAVLRQRVAAGSVLTIDARYTNDFDAGHIPGAVNLSILSANPAGIARVLAGVSKSQRIVVYCQSPSCPFTDRVAAALLDAGFRNVEVYRGGWMEWSHN